MEKSLLSKLFGQGEKSDDQLAVRFGRYDESYKDSSRYDAWDESHELFENGQFLDAYCCFFEYLKNSKGDNVTVERKEEAIHFELKQGSKLIHGMANANKLKAEAKVGRLVRREKKLLQRLLKRNFDLKYSRFSLTPEDEIAIFFDTYTVDGSPYKLYYALKELAINADKLDDLLLDQYDFIEPVDEKTILEIPDHEKAVKHRFIVQTIQVALQEIEEGPLDPDQYPAGISYLLLDLCYKLDYLTTPEGTMMETLERIHRRYFAKDEQFSADKNREMVKELKQLISRSKEDFYKEFYIITATFGITTPVNQDRIETLIEGELDHVDWYMENNCDAVAMSIPGYLIGYSLFNFSVPAPIRDLFHIYYQIVHQDFFNELGGQVHFRKGKRLNKRAIRKAIKKIEVRHRERFPVLEMKTDMLDCSNLITFSKSLLQMVAMMNVIEMNG